MADLPLKEDVLTPDLFARAAEKVELKARFLKHEISGLSDVFLPCVLILDGSSACVLTKLENGVAEVVYPNEKMVVEKISLADLEQEFSGYVILVAPVYKADNRVESLKQSDMKHWFWDTIWSFRREYVPLAISSLLINLFVIVTPIFVFNVYNKVLPNSAFFYFRRFGNRCFYCCDIRLYY